MTKLLQRMDVTLRSFYIFNSSLSKKEGDEHEKILYYKPSDIELNTKIKDVGLSEAIVAFTGTFTADESCKALHTQKTTQLFYQPEPGYWMILVINVPKEIRLKDGEEEVATYCGGEVHDTIYRAVLEQSYNMFRLFAGTFDMNFEAGGAKQLQRRLTHFYDKYLLSLKLSACDMWDLMRSIQYLPLDKFLFLRTHNFINMIRATFSVIKETIFLYNEQVVCSGKLDPLDLYSLHDYIVGTLLTKGTPSETASVGLIRSNSTSSDTYRNGGNFITGLENEEHPSKLPKVYLKAENGGVDDMKMKEYQLIVYRASNATLCLFINGDDEHQNDLYTELHSYMGPQLSNLARDIEENVAKQKNSGKVTTPADNDETSPKYLFINEQSLKHLSNISIDRRRPKVAQSIPTNVMNLIADLRIGERDTGSSNSFEEVQVKTTNDFWIVKRRCNWRQYYVIIFNSKATLLDVTQEAKSIFEQELTDDVFFDK